MQFGPVNTASGKFIPMRDAGGNTFRTQSAIARGDKFKVAINNSAPCYVYIFGEETDGSSYVLYPYTEKHSPYFGVMGSRLVPQRSFPRRRQSGQRDRVAIVFSKKEMDWNMVNTFINNSRQSSYAGKVQEALGNLAIQNAVFRAGESIEFAADVSERPALGVVLELDKR
ncbi:MAG: hypothetical protein R3B47_03760 [Bacteroidia bacterium]